MSFNMERFSPSAKVVVEAANRIATDKFHQKIETEHLLLALLSRSKKMILLMFPLLENKLEELRKNLNNSIKRHAKTNISREARLSLNAERAVQRAEYEAKRLKDKNIAPEHLLLGILSVPGSQAFILLSKEGLNNQSAFGRLKTLKKSKKIAEKNDVNEKAILSRESGSDEMVQKYCRSLVEMAKEKKLDPVIGRDEEIRRIIQVLSRRTKNNPALVGDPGVGKTAIVEGLAQRIYHEDVPEILKDSKLLSLDLAAMIAGTKYRGEFEERFKNLLKEIEFSSQNYILFIDELHTLIGAGATSQGALDASNMLKPVLARGMLRCVGATTIKEFKKYIERDPALERRFQQVLVEEPSLKDCVGILRGLKSKYEVHHGVRIKDSAIIASVRLSARYITDRYLPDKAIDLVDEAASAIRIEIDSRPTLIDQNDRKIIQLEIERQGLSREEDDTAAKARLKTIDQELSELRDKNKDLGRQWEEELRQIKNIRKLKEKIEAVKSEELEAQRAGDLELAAELKYGALDELEQKLLEANNLMKQPNHKRLLKEEIDEEDIASIISQWTGVPAAKIMQTEQKKLLNMEKVLSRELIGQEQALTSISNAIRRARTGVQNPDRPLGSFLFFGPSGVGKTELAKILASFLFNEEKAIIRLDMSEYIEKHTVSRLLGASPGHIGFEEGGILTEAVRRKPYSVILFDELEKAHPEIINILLQILDEGTLTDARGIKIDFKNSIIIITTNLGGKLILEAEAAQKEISPSWAREILSSEFRPELLNRLDEIIVFYPLTLKDLEQIVEIQFARLAKRIRTNNGAYLKITEDAKKYLARKGFEPEFGARPLNQTLRRLLEDFLARLILNGTIKNGSHMEIQLKDDKLRFYTTVKTTGNPDRSRAYN